MSENKGKDPIFDTSEDSDEPAFAWMTPSASPAAPASGGADTAAGKGEQSKDAAAAAGAATNPAPGKTSETKASAAAAPGLTSAPSAGQAPTVPSGVVREELPTSTLSVRSPEETTRRRQAAREAAVASRPVAPLVIKILSAIFLPLLLAIGAVRAVASPLFLWLEYNRPGFPADGYGFSQDDRITYGSYGVDYLSNFAGRRFLSDLVNPAGEKLFKDGEISHMADVKMVTMITWGAGALLLVLAIVALFYLGRRRDGSIRHALFSASVVSLVLIIALAVLGVLGWQSFFTTFHEIFFANGTWTFSMQDTLIRLYPGQFWIDSAITIAAIITVVSVLVLVFTWPTRKRRQASKDAVERRIAAQQEAITAGL